jgi:phage FluMu protein gp41
MKITKKPTDVLKVEDVELAEPTVETLIAAERISGKSSGFEFLACVLSQVGSFDGQALPPEEVRKLSSKDFLSLAGELDLADTETLPTASSTSSEKGSFETTA